MRSTLILRYLGAVWTICAAGVTEATYTIQDTFDISNFFDEFSFFSGPDPTHGFVEYQSSAAANTAGLAGYSNGQVYLGVDHTTVNPANGRRSVRLSSNKEYTHGLFIADIAHMPGGICGVWPAFWSFGPGGSGWPGHGEIDIIEGVNAGNTNAMTLHTAPGCTMSNQGSIPSTTLSDGNCNKDNAHAGCSQLTTDTNSYGVGFNSIGGGIYAMDWSSTSISVWFFPRSAIPSDILNGTPNPSGWGAPVSKFSGSECDIDAHFQKHKIIFNTTFCGAWAGQVWSSGTCASMATSCEAYVGANPEAFKNAYWTINSVKVYQNYGAAKRGFTEKAFEA